jgi:uncharacterized membrane protein
MRLKSSSICRRRLSFSTLIVLASSAFAAQAQAAPHYSPTIIEAPDNSPTEGLDVNNAGLVVGSYANGAFAWSRNGGFVHLEGSAQYWVARAVNECDQIVGANLFGHAMRWDTPTEVEDLGTLGGDESDAYDINDRGEIVGGSRVTDSGPVQPFIWTEDEGMRQLLDCGAFGGSAFAINNRREVVGRCNLPPNGANERAWYWSARTGKIDIPIEGFAISDAWDINDRGEVVGVANTGVQPVVVRGFRWTVQRGAVLLRDLGENFSYGHAINRAGWIIGDAIVQPPNGRQSVLWLARNVGFTIHPGVGELSYTGSLNDRGDVIDTVTFAGSGSRAVLWKAPRAVSQVLKRFGASRCLRSNSR